ncbi:MAG TPA: hypothetical protein DCQ98_15500 [Planctomycetaceae bacterium]|nr:hypothetical protein [Planctomycetaceae bacterium]
MSGGPGEPHEPAVRCKAPWDRSSGSSGVAEVLRHRVLGSRLGDSDTRPASGITFLTGLDVRIANRSPVPLSRSSDRYAS